MARLVFCQCGSERVDIVNWNVNRACLHCFTCGKDIFAAARIAEGLTTRDIAVLRFDFTGIGSSEGEFANSNFSSNVRDLLAAAGYLRLNHAAPSLLIGHSLGGAAMLAAAPHLPDATGWLPGPLRPVARWAAPAVLRGSATGRRAELTEWIRGAAGDLAFLSTRFIAFGDPNVSPAVIDFLERVIRATPIDVVADFYLALVEHDKRGALATIGRVPTVVLAGEQDRLIPAKQTAALAAAIPGAFLVTVPDAGHVLQLEWPDVVTEEISVLVAVALATTTGKRPA